MWKINKAKENKLLATIMKTWRSRRVCNTGEINKWTEKCEVEVKILVVNSNCSAIILRPYGVTSILISQAKTMARPDKLMFSAQDSQCWDCSFMSINQCNHLVQAYPETSMSSYKFYLDQNSQELLLLTSLVKPLTDYIAALCSQW